MSPKNEYCVYKHTSPSGKVYIGITKQNPLRRWRNGDGYIPRDGKLTPFVRAIIKYGWDSITHEIIKTGLSKAEACELEKYYIEEYRTQDRRYGYNVLSGGDIPLDDCPQSVKERMSESGREKWKREAYIESHTGENHWTHQKGYSQKSIEAMRTKNKGTKRTPEQIEFLREKGRKQKRLRGKENKKSIPILCFTKDGVFVGEYYGALEAERETGVCFQNIFKVCYGERKTAGGYIWKFSMEDNADEN